MIAKKRFKSKSDRRYTKKKRLLLMGFLALTVIFVWAALTNVVEAQVSSTHAFLNISGVNGGSTFVNYQGWMDLIQFSQTLGEGPNRNFGVCQCYAVKPLDQASPALWSGVVSTQVFDEAKVDLVRPLQGKLTRFFEQTMKNVLISQIQFGETNGQATETLTLLPESVTITYTPVNSKGEPGPPITSTVCCSVSCAPPPT